MEGVNYAALLPYIDVSDFKTAKELANYLLYLDTNTEEYLKYFEWKKTWFFLIRIGYFGQNWTKLKN